jgi:hypothetical protein
VFPVRYELDFYIPEDDILHCHRRENFKSSLYLHFDPFGRTHVARPGSFLCMEALGLVYQEACPSGRYTCHSVTFTAHLNTPCLPYTLRVLVLRNSV